MKAKIFLSLFVVVFTTAKAQDYSAAPELERKERVMYLKGSETPFSGAYHLNHENGKPFIRGEYVNGLKEGKWLAYDSLGVLRSEEFFVKDQWEGVRKTYHPGGNISTIENFKAGIRNGIQEGYYDNGQLTFRVNQVNGQKEGNWRYYHSNGRIWEKGKFKSDLNEGKWTNYDENKKVTMVRKYKKGEQVSGTKVEGGK